MKKKVIISIMVIGLLLMISIASVNAVTYNPYRIIYVDDDADPDWYDETHVKTINKGIEVAEDGDTIFVFSGTYQEWLRFSKSVKLIGEDKETTIIYKNAFEVSGVEGLKLSGFTIKGGEGIFMGDCNNCTISGNIVTNSRGFSLSGSSYNTIIGNTIESIEFEYGSKNNTFSENIVKQIEFFHDSGYNKISNNKITNSIVTYSGSSNNLIFNNTITGGGIELMSSYNTIAGNTISDICDDLAMGILIFSGKYNIISGNTISNITGGRAAVGIDLLFSAAKFNNISGNVIYNINGGSFACCGIEICSSGNNITRNKISDVDGDCIYLFGSDNKVIANNLTNGKSGITVEFPNNLIYYNNFINNKDNGYNYPFENNQWYLPIGNFRGKGNYWDDYTGNDWNGDGIGDTPYDIPAGEKDRFPFMEPIDIENIDISINVAGTSQCQQSSSSQSQNTGSSSSQPANR